MGRTKHNDKDKQKCKKVIDEEKEPNKMKCSKQQEQRGTQSTTTAIICLAP
jgi:hypothetical protein